jgi:hypothetical protein
MATSASVATSETDYHLENNLFVLWQQRGTPIPTILPIPSISAVGGVFDARLAVGIANTYLLTLSFGFPGASVSVLREIKSRLENFTLAPSRLARYHARILLGMVAGPTIGLFFDQEGRLLSLPPPLPTRQIWRLSLPLLRSPFWRASRSKSSSRSWSASSGSSRSLLASIMLIRRQHGE